MSLILHCFDLANIAQGNVRDELLDLHALETWFMFLVSGRTVHMIWGMLSKDELPQTAALDAPVANAGPCSGNTPHSHPRGSEISFVLYGNIEFGMIEENSGRNNLVLRNISQGQTIHVPTGEHSSHLRVKFSTPKTFMMRVSSHGCATKLSKNCISNWKGRLISPSNTSFWALDFRDGKRVAELGWHAQDSCTSATTQHASQLPSLPILPQRTRALRPPGRLWCTFPIESWTLPPAFQKLRWHSSRPRTPLWLPQALVEKSAWKDVAWTSLWSAPDWSSLNRFFPSRWNLLQVYCVGWNMCDNFMLQRSTTLF